MHWWTKLIIRIAWMMSAPIKERPHQHQGGVRLFIYKHNILPAAFKGFQNSSHGAPTLKIDEQVISPFRELVWCLRLLRAGVGYPSCFLFFSYLSAWTFIGTVLKPLSKECMLKYIAKLCLHAWAFLCEAVLTAHSCAKSVHGRNNFCLHAASTARLCLILCQKCAC